MKNKIGALSVSLALAAGCVSTVYKIDAPKSIVGDAKYAIKSVSGAGATMSNISSALRSDELSNLVATADGQDVLPVDVTVTSHEVKKDSGALSGFLWLCTVGLFPACESDSCVYDVAIKTPAGERSDSFKITRNSWMGWIPIFVPYPSFSDKRDGSMSYEPGDLVYTGVARTAIALASGIDYKGYLAEKQKKGEARKTELLRIEKRKRELQALLDKDAWNDVLSGCARELSERPNRVGAIAEDDIVWSNIKKTAQDEVDKIAAAAAAKEAERAKVLAEQKAVAAAKEAERIAAEAAKEAERAKAEAQEIEKAAKAEVKRLTDAELFDEALALCRQKSKESKKVKERRFWDDMASSVRIERKIAEKNAEKAKEAAAVAEKERKLVVAQQQFDKQLKDLDVKVKAAIEKESFVEAKNYVEAAELPSELFGIESFIGALAGKKTQLTAVIQQAEARCLGKKSDAIDVEALLQHVDGYMTSIPPQSDLRNIASWYRSRLCALKAGQLKTVEDKNSLLVGSVILRERALISWLLENGASADAISEKDSFSRPAVLFAAANGDVDVLKLLADKGANVSKSSKKGVTPIMAAAGAGQESTFEWLMAKGVSVKEADSEGITTLMYAAGGGSIKITLALISKGASINQKCRNNDGMMTAIVYAISGKKTTLVEKLIELGADPNASTGSNGENMALRAAIGAEDVAVVRALLTANTHGNVVKITSGDVSYAIKKTGQTAVVKLLIENGAPADTEGLLSAVVGGNTEIVDLLCKNGADVNGKTGDIDDLGCKSLLDVAIKKSDLNMVKMLVGLGADVSRIDVRKGGVDGSIRDYLISKGAHY